MHLDSDIEGGNLVPSGSASLDVPVPVPDESKGENDRYAGKVGVDDDSSEESKEAEDEQEQVKAQEPQDGYAYGGYHIVRIGETFNNRYKVIRKLGWGNFSTVWLCLDYRTGKHVALKIATSDSNAVGEIEMLKRIREFEGDPRCGKVVQMLDDFRVGGMHGSHVCVVMEAAGRNLLKLISDSACMGIPLPNVKSIIKQLLEAVAFIHARGIIHTDIKPENILLVADEEELSFLHRQADYWDKCGIEYPASAVCNLPDKYKVQESQKSSSTSLDDTGKPWVTEESSEVEAAVEGADAGADDGDDEDSWEEFELLKKIENPVRPMPVDKPNPAKELCSVAVKLGDLGNACFVNGHIARHIQTRAYRSLEVIIGAGYSTSADIWSVACTAFELATGEQLFQPQSIPDQSVGVDEHQLALFQEVLGKIPKSIALSGKFSPNLFDNEGSLKTGELAKLKYWPLVEVLAETYGWREEDAKAFTDFLLPMLDYDRNQRATAEQCLKHPWLCNAD